MLRGRPRLLTSALRFVIGSRPTHKLRPNDKLGKTTNQSDVANSAKTDRLSCSIGVKQEIDGRLLM